MKNKEEMKDKSWKKYPYMDKFQILKIFVIFLLILFSSGCTEDYTKDIKSNKCPIGYKKIDGFCEGTEDNVFYFETPKSKVIFHFPKDSKVDGSSKVVKKFFIKT